MFDSFGTWISQALSAKKPEESSDIFAIIMLAVVCLFFLWLVVAVVRKLSKPANRIGEIKEDEAEAARTARLWAEAKRRAEDDEDEEEQEEAVEEHEDGDIQAELVEKARQRREDRRQADEAAHKASQQALRAPQDPERDVEDGSADASPPEDGPAAATPPVAEAKAEPISPKTLEEGLKKTRSGFVSRLTSMFGKKGLDEDELEEIEEILFTADIGVRTAQKLLGFIEEELSSKQSADPDKLLAALKDRIHEILSIKAPPLDLESKKPFVILMVGVNGTGKTTTIGKLAMKHISEGHKVILAAGDTFRAAAAEQLQVWAERTGAQLVRGQEGGDPGAVIYDAISAAKSQDADLVIADTAGRLHTKVNLVEELKKVHRVCDKALPGAPHEVWLVLDATTGQNAINQAKQFHKALDVTGIVLTKLDGTAKGGVIIGITDSFGIPVRYIGIGEQAADLRPFDPDAFVKALFS